MVVIYLSVSRLMSLNKSLILLWYYYLVLIHYTLYYTVYYALVRINTCIPCTNTLYLVVLQHTLVPIQHSLCNTTDCTLNHVAISTVYRINTATREKHCCSLYLYSYISTQQLLVKGIVLFFVVGTHLYRRGILGPHILGQLGLLVHNYVVGKFFSCFCQLNLRKFLKVGNVIYCTRE